MATVLEECNTEEQSSVLRFFVGKGIFIKKCFLFMVGSVCRVKRFTTGSKRFADDEKVETEVRKWLRQQLKYFHAAGFDALVKRWTSVSMLVEDMSRNKCFFFPRFSAHL
jgi:hypothetical protein